MSLPFRTLSPSEVLTLCTYCYVTVVCGCVQSLHRGAAAAAVRWFLPPPLAANCFRRNEICLLPLLTGWTEGGLLLFGIQIQCSKSGNWHIVCAYRHNSQVHSSRSRPTNSRDKVLVISYPLWCRSYCSHYTDAVGGNRQCSCHAEESHKTDRSASVSTDYHLGEFNAKMVYVTVHNSIFV